MRVFTLSVNLPLWFAAQKPQIWAATTPTVMTERFLKSHLFTRPIVNE